MNKNNYLWSEFTDDFLHAQADVGHYRLDEEGRYPLRAWFDKCLHYRLALGTSTADDENKFVVSKLHILTRCMHRY